MSEDYETPADAMVVVAIMVSRVDALVTASVLEAAGLIVHVGGEYHASGDPLAVALGGYRLSVPQFQLADASNVLREAGIPDHAIAYEGGRLAVVRFLAVLLGFNYFFAIPAFIAGLLPLSWLGLLGLYGILNVQTDPRGRAEYFLSEDDA